MNVLNNPTSRDRYPRSRYRWLSALLGIATLLTFGTKRYLSETSTVSLGDIPAYVMGIVVIAVGASAFYTATRGHTLETGILVALGPVGGMAAYLIGYHLVLPPSTDSPTWLVFLAFAGGFLVLGVATHLIGRLSRKTPLVEGLG